VIQMWAVGEAVRVDIEHSEIGANPVDTADTGGPVRKIPPVGTWNAPRTDVQVAAMHLHSPAGCLNLKV